MGKRFEEDPDEMSEEEFAEWFKEQLGPDEPMPDEVAKKVEKEVNEALDEQKSEGSNGKEPKK